MRFQPDGEKCRKYRTNPIRQTERRLKIQLNYFRKGEGTYVLNPDGSVTFTPEAGFLGQASGVTVVRVDRNERKVTAQYVPTVVPVPVAPSEPEVQTQGLLPATGEALDYSFFSGVALTILASVGLVATRKRQATDED